MWRKIKGYETEYEINRTGDIRRLTTKKGCLGGKILKHGKASNGYIKIELCKNGKVKTFQLHRLLAQHFIDNPDNNPQVNHIDGNRSNFSLSNLEWVTARENLLHAIRVTKTHAAPLSMIGKFGKDHNRSKSFWIEDKFGIIKKYGSGLEFTRLTGLDHTSISYARKKALSSYRFVHGKMNGLTVHFEIKG